MSTKIKWATKVWNPTTGCSKVSAGCENCYAINMSNRLSSIESTKERYRGTVKRTEGGKLNWTGQVTGHVGQLNVPKRWKKPQRIFVGSMSDILHENIDFNFLREVFDTMSRCKQHTFMVLTKRPERLNEFWEWYADSEDLSPRGLTQVHIPNVWIGTSVENQEQAEKRIPHLLQVPAAVRFLSCEPLLGPVDISNYLHDSNCNEVRQEIGCICSEPREYSCDWLIAGGESGHNARPMHPDWVYTLRDQCQTANIPFFFNQWGEFLPNGESGDPEHQDSFTGDPMDYYPDLDKFEELQEESDKKLVVIKAHGHQFYKEGKKKAGRLLDGKEWNEFPIVETKKS